MRYYAIIGAIPIPKKGIFFSKKTYSTNEAKELFYISDFDQKALFKHECEAEKFLQNLHTRSKTVWPIFTVEMPDDWTPKGSFGDVNGTFTAFPFEKKDVLAILSMKINHPHFDPQYIEIDMPGEIYNEKKI